jgi:hypothetical protein
VSLIPAPQGQTQGDAPPSTTRRPLAVAIVLSAAVLMLAACGSAAATGGTSTTTKPKGPASLAAYTACLKQHGVTLPTFNPGSFTGGTRPTFSPGSFGAGSGAGRFGSLRNNPKFQSAEAACKSLRPSGGFGGFGGGAGGFNSTAFAAYRNCLKLHGVTLPAGRPSGSGSTPSTTIPTSTFQAAEAACAALRPTPSTTTTTAAS